MLIQLSDKTYINLDMVRKIDIVPADKGGFNALILYEQYMTSIPTLDKVFMTAEEKTKFEQNVQKLYSKGTT